MLEVFTDLRSNENVRIYGSAAEHIETAKRIANKYGYNYEGISLKFNAIFFGRSGASYNREVVTSALDRLRSEGYRISSLGVNIAGRGYFQCDGIEGKHYDAGRVTVMERGNAEYRKPILILGHDDQSTIIGLFIDTSLEHIDIVDEIVSYIGMEPRKRTELPSAFRNFLDELNLEGI